MIRSWVGVALGMLAAIASAVSGVLLLVRPYVSVAGSFVAAGLAMVPFVVLWRFLALGEAAPKAGARTTGHRPGGSDAEPSRAR